ncbi:MAG: SRPBCC family protein [Pseudomonadota bacterium]
MRSIFLSMAAFSVIATANAELTSSTTSGFTTVNEAIIDSDVATVWAVATQRIGDWWHPSHTISGDASRMSIDAVPQGCFCESLGENQGIVHLTVTFAQRPRLLRMTGGLGPLGLMGVNGNMLWEIEPDGEQTRVRFSYNVGGYSPDGLDSIAPAVDSVIGEALTRLKAFVETGQPSADE